jgi:hypothetical protein
LLFSPLECQDFRTRAVFANPTETRLRDASPRGPSWLDQPAAASPTAPSPKLSLPPSPMLGMQ